MTIQLNSDNNLTLHEAFRTQLNTLITWWVWYHIKDRSAFSDENKKEGQMTNSVSWKLDLKE
jgi:hypothetical protein